jgi:hypothetical protein
MTGRHRPTPGEDEPLGIEEVVERVARAIADLTPLSSGRYLAWESRHREEREVYYPLARAAIEAYEQARASTGEQP